MKDSEVIEFLEAHEQFCFENGRISMSGALRRAKNVLLEIRKEKPGCISSWWNK